MQRYRRRQVRLSRVEHRDFSKRGAYVRLDLFVRLLSAMALAALGAAGWWFQVTTQREHDAIDKRSREARKSLPAVRALIDLEITLEQAAATLLEHGTNSSVSPDDASFFELLASRIDAAAISTAIIQDDPQAPLLLPSFYGDDLSPRQAKNYGVRSSAIMLAELLRLLAASTRPGWCEVGSERHLDTRSLRLLISESHSAIILVYCRDQKTGDEYGDAQVSFVIPASESAAIWRAWLNDRRDNKARLDTILKALPRAILAVRRQAATASQDVMRAYPELGDQFVAVRAEAVRVHQNDHQVVPPCRQ
jgi:hypothetical protein